MSTDHTVGAQSYEGPRTALGRFAGNRPPPSDTVRKERQALKLRMAGHTFDRIAEKVGYADRSAASKAVRRAVARTNIDTVEEYRTLELARLERLHRAVWDQALGGDLEAVDRALRVSRERRRLLGLDAPTRTDLRISGSLEAQIDELVAELARGAPAPPGHLG